MLDTVSHYEPDGLFELLARESSLDPQVHVGLAVNEGGAVVLRADGLLVVEGNNL
jgi:hypothetical protein